MNKKRLKSICGALLLTASLGTEAGRIYENNTDHLHEYCLLNNVFGLEHQLNKINDDPRSVSLNVVYVPSNIDESEYQSEHAMQFNTDTYAKFYGQHVVEFVKPNNSQDVVLHDFDINNNFDFPGYFFIPGSNEATGDERIYGERIELYTNDEYSNDSKLIRVLKK